MINTKNYSNNNKNNNNKHNFVCVSYFFQICTRQLMVYKSTYMYRRVLKSCLGAWQFSLDSLLFFYFFIACYYLFHYSYYSSSSYYYYLSSYRYTAKTASRLVDFYHRVHLFAFRPLQTRVTSFSGSHILCEVVSKECVNFCDFCVYWVKEQMIHCIISNCRYRER